jgi:L-serine deaminase
MVEPRCVQAVGLLGKSHTSNTAAALKSLSSDSAELPADEVIQTMQKQGEQVGLLYRDGRAESPRFCSLRTQLSCTCGERLAKVRH